MISKLLKVSILGMVCLWFTSCEKEKVVQVGELPTVATAYIETHFPGEQILQVKRELDNLRKSYDVILSNGFKLEFSKTGDVKGVEGTSALPNSVIPSKILTYVQTNYAGQAIFDWELDDNRQEVKLQNGLELVFDKQGNFIQLD